jgi:hypothetical protein
MKIISVFALLLLFGCNMVKDKVKEGAHKAGEAGGEIIKQVSSGVGQAFDIDVKLDVKLAAEGLQLGKCSINSSKEGNDDMVDAYIIFNNDFSKEVLAKAFDQKGMEMGRVKLQLSGKKGEAGYFSIAFDKKTNIDRDCKITIE